MPPAASQKGTGKKAGPNAMRQRSRNTTPSSVVPSASLPPIEAVDTDYLELRVEQFRNLNYDDLVDQGASNAVIPDSKSLDGMIARLQRLQETIDRRSNFCDRGMRILASTRKQYINDVDEDAKEGVKAEGDSKKTGKTNKKKRKAADTLAPQDAAVERSSPLRESTKPRKLSRDNDSASSSLSPVAPATPSAMEVDNKTKAEENEEEEESSEDEGAPPKKAQPAAHTFGDDPSTFPDPTVYEILPTKPGMSADELRQIYSVAVFPQSDLADLIAGDPPDKDFSSAKPSNQISFSTFSTYMEPYFRPFAEEDLAFLRERGDRVTPFHMPKRGKKHYTEIWAEEDGAMSLDKPPNAREQLAPNQARGAIDNMDDEVAETDKLSVGPLLSRLMQAMRPENRPQADEEKTGVNGITNGDTAMNGSVNGDNGDAQQSFSDDKAPPVPPAAFMPESNSEAWKKASHPKLEYTQVDERIKQELRHIGFLPQEGNFEGEYDGAFDDEVAARLRLLQGRLREQMLINGARKARLTELVKERMAHQEYQTILEDLDSQVQAAYLKRTRTMGKSKKNKRPGGAGGGSHAVGGAAGMARPGIGDMTKTLMERRKRWIDTIGSVFDDEKLGKVPRSSEPDSSIFRAGIMGDLMKKEKAQWDEEVEEE
ncbi:Chromatin-remodeling complexes subunit NGG1 [Colletotrichum gloeosporioides]|uniref:Histone acetyltransferase subunit 3 n=2 Tax=Colletotrichum gloeosporioides TaxID=474922 RepID=T0JVG9_COLGC|nr:Chromatin-remodeling complexes subunit NGG1 [Colletotrichum gloeosporioides]EQB44543.1 histone acetyltransferase subunit 3 [Colletotrichum gloeosporioides Cg-14]KAF3805294.1 Chromatin-remodeling complexes subunit NGG1 [Colletotrichum gloeosporioides]